MVYLKKIFIFFIFFIIALIINEIIFAKIIGYPRYGVYKKIHGIRKTENEISEIYYPHSKYWTVEGGNKVYTRNNIGLPGKDVIINDSINYIFVLGDSFVEAYQVSPLKMATSIFDDNIDKIKKENLFEVINLGHSGHTAYDCYLRCSFYKNKYFPYAVFLVISSVSDEDLKFNKFIKFNSNDVAVYDIKSPLVEMQRILRNKMTLINISALYLKNINLSEQKEKFSNLQNNPNNSVYRYNESDSNRFNLLNVLLNFKNDYDKFYAVIATYNEKDSTVIKNFCDKNGIKIYFKKDILRKENRINHIGHLNETGNLELGNELTKIFLNNENE